MNITQPIYTLSINVNNCNAEIWCNDVILFEFKPLSTQNQGLSITIPINQLILKQSEFEIKAVITPSFRKETLLESSFVHLQLSVKSKTNNKNSFRLLELKTPNAIDEENPLNIKDVKTLEGLPSYELLGVYKDKILPFEALGWTESVNLLKQNPQSLLTQGFKFFKNLETIINNKQIPQFIKLNEDKNRLLKETLYLTNEQHEKCKIEDITLLIDKGYKLIPIDFDNIEHVLMGRGRLLKLRRKNGLSLIVLNNPHKKSSAEFDIKLHKKTANSDFSII
ncbi:hypothetical protein [Aquimarina sp. 2201CG14-23]|uniref:hypothetical protein n=1 Tax=Aquimarina mycalae TaxID=3040073 RepID=UPI0024781760|nr:hypothetical protein [Aquimarina sp. 2201CG14-23]MDH7448219.1 hypothetical protein [Aquimarina sp. 2201CG14-23]